MPVKGQRQIYKPWVKLHLRMLHNHEVAQLPDSSYRRFTECLLFAGEERNKAIEEKREVIEGLLPDIGYMAWTLHITVAALTDDMSRLALAGLVELHESGRWFVTNFAKWQAPSTDAERQRQHREKEKESTKEKEKDKDIRDRVIDSVTVVTTPSQNVTSRYTPPDPSMIANLHPAVKAVWQVTTFWPGEITHPVIIEKLGDNPDISVLGRAYQLWVSNGYKPTNYAGMCDWYQEIVRDPKWTPQTRFKNGGKPVDTAIETDALWQRAVKEISSGAVTDDLLRRAIQAIGGSSSIKMANEYTASRLKERLYHEYRNIAPA